MKTQLGVGGEITRRDGDREPDPDHAADHAADHALDQTVAASESGASSPGASHPHARAHAHAAGDEPARGDTVGRFVVLEELGVGGMGVVYSAYDPQLDRKVAIKLLAAAARTGDDAKLRLLREAQAMAKINHPNVVKVHEVGTYGEQIYLAMEFADAGTLRGWLKAPRDARAILDVFGAAGRGLAAAHALGLVHRDFKPDNVLMSKDGGVRVTDFGLVIATDAAAIATAKSEPSPAVELTSSLSGNTPLSQNLTRTGAVLGTPTYMAPEQFSGDPPTAKTDQFAFCVALYEALYRVRPFAGDNYAELSTNVVSGELLPAPSGARVPAWLRRVLVRGLATDPVNRHASMAELIAALSRDPSRRRKRVAAWMAGVALAGAGVAAAVLWSRQGGPVCGTGDDRVATAWSPSERAKLEQAFVAAGRPNGGAVAEHVEQIVDRWTSAWKQGYVDACRATHERGEQSAQLLDLRMQCLTRRLATARATIDLMAAGGADAVDHGLDAALALPTVAPCADAVALTAAVAPPEGEAARAAVDLARKQLDLVAAQEKLGRYRQARAVADTALAAARATKYGPIIAEALYALGDVQSGQSEPAAADTLGEAMQIAAEAGDTATLIAAASGRMFELTQTARYAAARELGVIADALAKHAPPPPMTAVRLGNAEALLLVHVGEPKAAQARYEQTLAFAQRELGPEHTETLSTLNQLGNLYKDEGRYDDARKALEQVLAITERAAGKDHPGVASALNNLANVYRVEGKLPAAKQLYDRALAIRLAVLGPDHPDTGASYQNLCTYFSDAGDAAAALASCEHALAIFERAYGKDSALLVDTLNDLGTVLTAQGDNPGARAQYERARALLETAHGPDFIGLAGILNNLGVLAEDDRRFDDALALYQRALAITEKTYGPDHPDVADYLANIEVVYKRSGKLKEADEMSARVIALTTKIDGADSAQLGERLINYGSLQLERKDYAAALATFQKSLAILEGKLGKDHPNVSYSLSGVADALTSLGRQAEAVPYAERALAIRVATKQPPALIAESRFDLAEALVVTPATRARAIDEAKTALGEYQSAKDDDDAKEVTGWLRQHH